MRPQGPLIQAPDSAGGADDGSRGGAMNRAKRHAVSACSLRPANVIPLVVPLARFSAWMARTQADGIAEEETNGSAISRRPRGPRQSRRDPGPHEIAPAIR